MWVFPTKQFSNSVQISAVCPTILFSCDTNYLELVQTSLVKGSAPQDCPPTSDSNCKYWVPSYPQFIWLVLKFGIHMTLSSSLIICYDNTWKSGTFLIYSKVYNLESLLDCKEIQPVHSKGDQSWVLFGKTDAKAETPILWPPHVSWLIGKDSVAGRDWGRRRGEQQRMSDWMVSPTWCAWVWVNSRIWWWTGRPGVLQFMGSQRVRHDWATEPNRTEW